MPLHAVWIHPRLIPSFLPSPPPPDSTSAPFFPLDYFFLQPGAPDSFLGFLSGSCSCSWIIPPLPEMLSLELGCGRKQRQLVLSQTTVVASPALCGCAASRGAAKSSLDFFRALAEISVQGWK